MPDQRHQLLNPNAITTRVLIALLIAALLPLTIILIVTHTFTSQSLREAEYNQISNVTNEVVKKIEGYLRDADRNLASLAANPKIIESVQGLSETEKQRKLEDKREWFNRTVEFYNEFNDIVLYGRDGFPIVAKVRNDEPYQEKNPLFDRALLGHHQFSKPEIRELTARQAVPDLEILIYHPVASIGGKPEFIIKASLNFSPIWETLTSARLGKTGKFALIDQHNNILYDADRTKILNQKWDESVQAPEWLAHSKGLYEDYLYFAQAVSNLDTAEPSWILFGFKRKEEANQLLSSNTRHTLIAGFITLVLAIWLGILLSRKISKPVETIAEATQLVSQGNLSIEVPKVGPTEMQTLAQDFNTMVARVQEHQHKLEFEVAEQTRQLADTTAQLRATYESTREAILVVKMDGNVLAVNARFSALFDISPEDAHNKEKLEAALAKHFHEDDGFISYWHHCNDSLSRVDEAEWKLSREDHAILSIYNAPVRNASGVTFARLWMFRDLTVQRNLEDGLRQAQKMEAVGRLAGGVAHDFNNLLTGIIGNLALAEVGWDRSEKEKRELIASAKHAGERAAELVKQLLGFSRRSHLEIESCSAEAIAKDIEKLLRHTIDPRIQMVLEFPPDLWSIRADPNQVEQVIMNMAVNAKDAMPNGGRLKIAAKNLEINHAQAALANGAIPGDYVRVSIEDTGQGMSAEVRANIFEPFFTTKGPGKGTGLGLATSYGIIQQHGGWIVCESEEGSGTTFHLYFPRAEKTSNETPEAPREPAIRGGNETVLIVDDEAVVRMVGVGVLKHHGYQVVTANDGEEALEIMDERGNKIDVVMLDLTMPRLSGQATFQRLKRGPYANVPVVVCSGYLVDLDEFSGSLGRRPEGFIQKPYDSENLARTLRSILDRRS